SRTELGWRTVLVGAANEQNFGAGLAAETCMHVGGKQRTDEIAKMLHAIDVGNGAGDEIAGHGSYPCARTPNPAKSKSPSAGRKSSGSANASRGHASTLPANILVVGPGHSMGNNGNRYEHGPLNNGSSAENQQKHFRNRPRCSVGS